MKHEENSKTANVREVYISGTERRKRVHVKDLGAT
jgi:hypothetical protein